MIIFVAENVRSGIEWETLIEAPPYLLVPCNHRLAKKRAVTFGDMAGLPLVLLDLPFTSEYYRALLETTGWRLLLSPRPRPRRWCEAWLAPISGALF